MDDLSLVIEVGVIAAGFIGTWSTMKLRVDRLEKDHEKEITELKGQIEKVRSENNDNINRLEKKIDDGFNRITSLFIEKLK